MHRHACGNRGSADRMPQQQSLQLDSGPNISLLADKLQNRWREKLNMHLGNSLIRPCSNRKVGWSCDQCPDGLPHVCQATVSNRRYGGGGPFCSGRATFQHNTQQGTTGCVLLGCQNESCHVSRPSDCLQPHKSPLDVQRLLAQVTGSGAGQGAHQDWMPEMCQSKRWQENRWH